MKSRTLRYITKNQVKRFNWSQKKNKFPLSLNTNKILSKLKLASNRPLRNVSYSLMKYNKTQL